MQSDVTYLPTISCPVFLSTSRILLFLANAIPAATSDASVARIVYTGAVPRSQTGYAATVVLIGGQVLTSG